MFRALASSTLNREVSDHIREPRSPRRAVHHPEMVGARPSLPSPLCPAHRDLSAVLHEQAEHRNSQRFSITRLRLAFLGGVQEPSNYLTDEGIGDDLADRSVDDRIRREQRQRERVRCLKPEAWSGFVWPCRDLAARRFFPPRSCLSR